MSAAIGGAASVVNQPNTTPGANGFADLTSGEFLQIILSELSNQDPLNPMDNAEFTAQMAQFASLEQLQNINGNKKTRL